MDKSNIIYLPSGHLRQRSKKVGLITKDIEHLINGMKAATLDWEETRQHEVGVALAAIQVDRPLKIVIIRNNFDNKKDTSFSVFVNPVIVKYEGKVELDFEGCLSVPDIYGKVPRHTKVRVKALDEHGRELRLKAEGFLARVLQHEIDHTKGKMFVDHIKAMPDAFYTLLGDGHLKQLDYEKDIRTSSVLW